ncbi:hypothetical protein ASG87_04040 [Frateuria sp. Soil773]|uniref:hypothetical protein n=1 Tax=Frateuria sp. Soil773 TaxID=1736407 RepID=UPI0006FA66FD|nr:hypothetical protein [Frateuria sp. Soil773]KRE89505.1 hypothetical protein ASG87_04040 [Frateuria sp. Soil773]
MATASKSRTPRARATAALDVALRTLAATFGGYAIAALCTALLPRLLPLPRNEAVVAATLLSFAIYATVVLWAFATASAWRLCGWVLGILAVLGAAAWLSGLAGARL